MMQYSNISGYKFITLEKIATLKVDLLKFLKTLGIKGTILLSHEGININLAGLPQAIESIKDFFNRDPRFKDIAFKLSFSTFIPFSKMVIKLKKEIISMGVVDKQPPSQPENTITPKELKQWYDEKKDFILLDTRNRYEAKIGTFENAKLLPLNNFRQFPKIMQEMRKNSDETDNTKPIVMFCTGGVRCEKAMPYLQALGYTNIFQLHGGILKYFEECQGAHYNGECFVFDDRIAVDPTLQVTGTKLCKDCQEPVTMSEQAKSQFDCTQQCLQCKK